jgi:phosphate starvation-inducible protein PhoH
MAKKIPEVVIQTEIEKPVEFKLPELKFKTKRQFDITKLLLDENSKIVFLEGMAGTGKTLLSVYAALKLLKQNKVSEIIYIRSAVESSDYSLGYLPGELSSKIDVYMAPLEEKLEMFLSQTDIKFLKNTKKIKAMPINFLRGVDWQNKCIITDESQNFSFNEFKTFLTRIGEDCKVFILGDKMQSDIGNKSALPRMLELFSGPTNEEQGIYIESLGEEDIVRSGICRHILKQFIKIDKLVRL